MTPPPHHPLPPERAGEPQFTAPAWAESAPGGPDPSTGLDGAPPPRSARRPLLPWALLAAVVAAGAWMGATVVLPLRAEAVQCQAQLLAAQAAFVPAEETAPDAEADVIRDAAADAPTGGPDGQTAQLQVDALVEHLTQAVGQEAALGRVAVHPDEGSVRVVVSADVTAEAARAAVFGPIAGVLHAMPTPWEVVVEVARPMWTERRSSHRRRRGHAASAEGDGGAATPAVQRLLTAVAAADEALNAAHVAWLLRLVSAPAGTLVVRLTPVPHQGASAPTGPAAQ